MTNKESPEESSQNAKAYYRYLARNMIATMITVSFAPMIVVIVQQFTVTTDLISLLAFLNEKNGF